MEHKIPKTHHRFTSIPDVLKISQPFHDDTGYVKFMGCGTVYDNGKDMHLTTAEDWAEQCYDKYLFGIEATKKRMNIGFNYWKRNKQKIISEADQDARDNFNIAGQLEFVTRDEVNKCFHLFSFYSDREHEDRAYYFYDVHRGKLLKFISYFQRAAAKLIKKANQANNLITVSGYSIEGIENPFRNYNKELLLENANTELTSREFEIMCMVSNGFSAEQIGNMLEKSTRTIQTYIDRLNKNYGFKNRSEMRKYVVTNGYDNLDSFFLDSYPIYIFGEAPGDEIPSVH